MPKSSDISPERREQFEELGRARLRMWSDVLMGATLSTSSKIDMSILDGASLKEREIFDRYERVLMQVGSWLSNARNDQERARSGMLFLSQYVNVAIMSESFENYLKGLPAIMSGKDYLKTKRLGIEEYFTKDGKNTMASAFELFTEAVDHFMMQLKEKGDDHTPIPLKAIKEQYQRENVGSQYILEVWNRVNRNGFYTLANGERSEIMTRSDFEAFLDQEEWNDTDDIIKHHLDGGVINLEKELATDPDGLRGITWNEVNEKARAVKKWDVIQRLSKIYEEVDDLSDMMDEFPELVAIVCSQIELDFKIRLKDIPPKDWKMPFISRRKLYGVGFYSERMRAGEFYQHKLGTGAAVIQDRWEMSDAKKYTRPEPWLYREAMLESLIDGEGSSMRIKEVRRARYDIEAAFYALKGHNLAIELIDETFHLPGLLRGFRVDTTAIGRQLNSLRCDVNLLYRTIRGLAPDAKKRTQKLKAIKDYFLLPWVEKDEIPPRNILRAKRMIANLNAFQPKHHIEFWGLLVKRPQVDYDVHDIL